MYKRNSLCSLCAFATVLVAITATLTTVAVLVSATPYNTCQNFDQQPLGSAEFGGAVLDGCTMTISSCSASSLNFTDTVNDLVLTITDLDCGSVTDPGDCVKFSGDITGTNSITINGVTRTISGRGGGMHNIVNFTASITGTVNFQIQRLVVTLSMTSVTSSVAVHLVNVNGINAPAKSSTINVSSCVIGGTGITTSGNSPAIEVHFLHFNAVPPVSTSGLHTIEASNNTVQAGLALRVSTSNSADFGVSLQVLRSDWTSMPEGSVVLRNNVMSGITITTSNGMMVLWSICNSVSFNLIDIDGMDFSNCEISAAADFQFMGLCCLPLSQFAITGANSALRANRMIIGGSLSHAPPSTSLGVELYLGAELIRMKGTTNTIVTDFRLTNSAIDFNGQTGFVVATNADLVATFVHFNPETMGVAHRITLSNNRIAGKYVHSGPSPRMARITLFFLLRTRSTMYNLDITNNSIDTQTSATGPGGRIQVTFVYVADTMTLRLNNLLVRGNHIGGSYTSTSGEVEAFMVLSKPSVTAFTSGPPASAMNMTDNDILATLHSINTLPVCFGVLATISPATFTGFTVNVIDGNVLGALAIGSQPSSPLYAPNSVNVTCGNFTPTSTTSTTVSSTTQTTSTTPTTTTTGSLPPPTTSTQLTTQTATTSSQPASSSTTATASMSTSQQAQQSTPSTTTSFSSDPSTTTTTETAASITTSSTTTEAVSNITTTTAVIINITMPAALRSYFEEPPQPVIARPATAVTATFALAAMPSVSSSMRSLAAAASLTGCADSANRSAWAEELDLATPPPEEMGWDSNVFALEIGDQLPTYGGTVVSVVILCLGTLLLGYIFALLRSQCGANKLPMSEALRKLHHPSTVCLVSNDFCPPMMQASIVLVAHPLSNNGVLGICGIVLALLPLLFQLTLARHFTRKESLILQPSDEKQQQKQQEDDEEEPPTDLSALMMSTVDFLTAPRFEYKKTPTVDRMKFFVENHITVYYAALDYGIALLISGTAGVAASCETPFCCQASTYAVAIFSLSYLAVLLVKKPLLVRFDAYNIPIMMCLTAATAILSIVAAHLDAGTLADGGNDVLTAIDNINTIIFYLGCFALFLAVFANTLPMLVWVVSKCSSLPLAKMLLKRMEDREEKLQASAPTAAGDDDEIKDNKKRNRTKKQQNKPNGGSTAKKSRTKRKSRDNKRRQSSDDAGTNDESARNLDMRRLASSAAAPARAATPSTPNNNSTPHQRTAKPTATNLSQSLAVPLQTMMLFNTDSEKSNRKHGNDDDDDNDTEMLLSPRLGTTTNSNKHQSLFSSSNINSPLMSRNMRRMVNNRGNEEQAARQMNRQHEKKNDKKMNRPTSTAQPISAAASPSSKQTTAVVIAHDAAPAISSSSPPLLSSAPPSPRSSRTRRDRSADFDLLSALGQRLSELQAGCNSNSASVEL